MQWVAGVEKRGVQSTEHGIKPWSAMAILSLQSGNIGKRNEQRQNNQNENAN